MLNKNILILTIISISLLFISGCVAGGNKSDSNGNLIVNITNPSYEDKALVGIDYAHWKTHEGEHYYKREYYTLSNGQVLNILLSTNDKEAHLLPQFIANNAPIEVIFYENVSISALGTPISYFNSNRNYNDTNGLSIYQNPTITNIGTYLGKNLIGSGQKLGGEIRGNSELVLKPNTNYVFKITNKGSTSNIVNCNFDWYDEE